MTSTKRVFTLSQISDMINEQYHAHHLELNEKYPYFDLLFLNDQSRIKFFFQTSDGKSAVDREYLRTVVGQKGKIKLEPFMFKSKKSEPSGSCNTYIMRMTIDGIDFPMKSSFAGSIVFWKSESLNYDPTITNSQKYNFVRNDGEYKWGMGLSSADEILGKKSIYKDFMELFEKLRLEIVELKILRSPGSKDNPTKLTGSNKLYVKREDGTEDLVSYLLQFRTQIRKTDIILDNLRVLDVYCDDTLIGSYRRDSDKGVKVPKSDVIKSGAQNAFGIHGNNFIKGFIDFSMIMYTKSLYDENAKKLFFAFRPVDDFKLKDYSTARFTLDEKGKDMIDDLEQLADMTNKSMSIKNNSKKIGLDDSEDEDEPPVTGLSKKNGIIHDDEMIELLDG